MATVSLEIVRSEGVRQTTTSNRKTELALIPDYVSSAVGRRGEIVDIFVVEVKAPDRNQSSDDYFKLGEEMKRMTTRLENLGLRNAKVCGLLVDGWNCTGYTMFLRNEAVYAFVEIGSFQLIKHQNQLCLLKNAVEILQTIKLTILETAKLVQDNDLELWKSNLVRESYTPGYE
ncbi:hypothetical protein BX666DRAFT_1902885 [Dichotomocladium elegans]|nr:hypothetical protein BX666DRAFT_1902885 [Dichotomocladium elegans]